VLGLMQALSYSETVKIEGEELSLSLEKSLVPCRNWGIL
jgi:hypothetical protein